jgi:hypothetical protein
VGDAVSGWGLDPWGTSPWGGGSVSSGPQTGAANLHGNGTSVVTGTQVNGPPTANYGAAVLAGVSTFAAFGYIPILPISEAPPYAIIRTDDYPVAVVRLSLEKASA